MDQEAGHAGSMILSDAGSVDLESIGIAPLSFISNQHMLTSIDRKDDSSTHLTELMKVGGESFMDCPVGGIPVIIIDGEKLQVGEGSNILSHITTDIQLDGHANDVNLSNGTSVLQIVTSNNQTVEPPEGKVPISRIPKSTGSESVVVAPTKPTAQPCVVPKSVGLDLSGANLLAGQSINGPNLLLQLQTEEGVSNCAILPVVIPTEPEAPEVNVSRDCLWKGCGKVFNQMEDLVNHVNDQHIKVSEREVEYICEWENCPRKGKGFNARYKILIHVRTHTKEKPHNCPICGKCFSRLENLKIHSRSHTGEKPYLCPFEGCFKAYSNSSDRFKHVRTHQVDRPYLCKMPGCRKRYTDPSSLRKHVKTHGHFSRQEHEEKESEKIRTCLDNTNTSSSSEVPNSSQSQTSVPNSNYVISSVGFTPTTSSSTPQPGLSPILSIHGTTMEIPDLSSNPLLTSTVLTNGVGCHSNGTKADLSDLPLKELGSHGTVEVLESEKGQETPLDLSTSPMASMEMINTAGI